MSKTIAKRTLKVATKKSAIVKTAKSKKPAAKTTTKKTTAKKAVVKKPVVRKPTAKKAAPKKIVRKAAPKKSVARKPVAKKAAPKKAVASKPRISVKSAAITELCQIKGIGPKFAEGLYNSRIKSVQMIAKLVKKDIERLSTKLKIGDRMRREDWVGQAKTLARKTAKRK